MHWEAAKMHELTRYAAACALAALTWPAQGQDPQRAFDFEFGAWTAHVARLTEPLSGSDTWVEYTGTSVVQPWWDGRANIGELRIAGPTGAIQGMSLRLYEPASRQWYIRWANSRTGELGPYTSITSGRLVATLCASVQLGSSRRSAHLCPTRRP
jgi:hypothetical protein